jgi:hypothetical protein
MTISLLHKDRKEDHIEECPASSSHGWVHCKSYTKLTAGMKVYFQPVWSETDMIHNANEMLNKLDSNNPVLLADMNYPRDNKKNKSKAVINFLQQEG